MAWGLARAKGEVGAGAEVRKGLELGSGQWAVGREPPSSAPAQQAGGHARRIRCSWSWVGSRSRSGHGAVVQRRAFASGSFLHPWLKSAIQGCCRAQNRVEGRWGRSPACFSIPETPRIRDSVAGSVGAEHLGCGFKGG